MLGADAADAVGQGLEQGEQGRAVQPVGAGSIVAVAQQVVEVIDAQGQVVFSRIVKAGEQVGVDGALPLRVRVGNVAVTRLSFRGQALDLAAATRDNVARLELR